MQNNNRPEGRKRRIEGTGSGLYRRGEGLNTGPVGKGQSAAPKKVTQQFTENGGGGNYRGKRGGGGGIGIIAIILLLLFGGGGGALSGLFGGGSSSTQTQEQTVYVTPAPKPSAAVQTPAQSVPPARVTSSRPSAATARTSSPSWSICAAPTLRQRAAWPPRTFWR